MKELDINLIALKWSSHKRTYLICIHNLRCCSAYNYTEVLLSLAICVRWKVFNVVNNHWRHSYTTQHSQHFLLFCLDVRFRLKANSLYITISRHDWDRRYVTWSSSNKFNCDLPTWSSSFVVCAILKDYKIKTKTVLNKS